MRRDGMYNLPAGSGLIWPDGVQADAHDRVSWLTPLDTVRIPDMVFTTTGVAYVALHGLVIPTDGLGSGEMPRITTLDTPVPENGQAPAKRSIGVGDRLPHVGHTVTAIYVRRDPLNNEGQGQYIPMPGPNIFDTARNAMEASRIQRHGGTVPSGSGELDL